MFKDRRRGPSLRQQGLKALDGWLKRGAESISSLYERDGLQDAWINAFDLVAPEWWMLQGIMQRASDGD